MYNNTKVTLYAIWKDVTPPVIGTLTFSPTTSTQGDVTLTGKATDLGSGISYYQFSTNGNLTSSSSGWISITNTTDEITKTYSVSSNGTYFFYAKDAAGNVNKKAIIISNIRYVAQIGNIKYRTLREAIEAVKTDETILMIGDTTENNTVPEGKKFTLDLGEQTITGMFINNGNITITGNGTIYMETLLKADSDLATDEYNEVLINNYGILTINSGNYKAEKRGGTIIQNHETMTMNSGNIERNGDGWGIDNLKTFYFNGGTISLNAVGFGNALYNTSGTIEMTGGTINSKSYGLVIDGGEAITYGGKINITDSAGNCGVLVRNNGKGTFINTTINGYDNVIYNSTDSFNNCVVRNRTSNYGITGSIAGKVLATTNTDAGQSNEKVTVYNSEHGHLLFPTWTEKNGQDDIDWMRSQSSSQTHTITVEKSKHNNETGVYNVHIYAASGDGNWNAEKGLGNITLEL